MIDKSLGTFKSSFLALRIIASARKSLEAKIPVIVGYFFRKFFKLSVNPSKSSPISSSFGSFIPFSLHPAQKPSYRCRALSDL